MDRLSKSALHLAMPIAVGLVMGLNGVRLGAHLPLEYSVLFWVTASLGLWTIFEIAGRAMTTILRPWSPPFLVVLLATMPIAALPGRLFLYTLIGLFNPLINDGTQPRQFDQFAFSWPYLIAFLENWAGYLTFWLCLNLVLNKVMGIARFGYPGSTPGSTHADTIVPVRAASDTQARRPQFMDRVPIGLGDDLLVLSAQDHYLQVRTTRGSTLILSSIGDAVNQLQACGWDGIRIHRSHWIARDAVDHFAKRGNRHVVYLKHGEELPVGQTYLQLVRDAGFVERLQTIVPRMATSR